MSRALLDFNVLVALLDADHVDHERAHAWLDAEIGAGWASCPITENGFVRDRESTPLPESGAPREAIARLGRAGAGPQHEFWPCDVSVLDEAVVDATRLHGPRQVTDAYLLALATRREGRFVTFDRSIPLDCVVGAAERHLAVL